MSQKQDPERNMGAWKCVGEVAFPTNLETVDDVMALVRLVTKASADTWLSMYFYGPPQVSLLRGRTRGEGNVATMLSCLMKPNARPILFIKNARKRPSKLVRQPRAFLEQRRFYLDRRVGQLWGIDWETQLVGDGAVLPPRPLTIKVGDALVIEGPLSDDKGEYKYVTSVFMDDCDVMSKPIDETIEPVKGKKKKKKKEAGDAAEPDPLQRLMFVALRAGTCVLFVDLSWEDQEEKLARLKGLSMPVAENSVARIGPIEVAVEEQTEKPKDGTLVWWNGVEWSNKKGPAKRKKKKR